MWRVIGIGVGVLLGMALAYGVYLAVLGVMIGESMRVAANPAPSPWSPADKARVVALQADGVARSGLVSPPVVFDGAVRMVDVTFLPTGNGDRVSQRDVLKVLSAATKGGVRVRSCQPPFGVGWESQCGLMVSVTPERIVVGVGRAGDGNSR